MRVPRLAAAAAALVTALAPSAAPAQPAAGQSASPCDRGVAVEFVCNVSRPEDLVQVPRSQWIIVGNLTDAAKPGSGGLTLLDPRSRTAAKAAIRIAPARAPYHACPGPLDTSRFSGHGVNIRPARRGVSTLFVVGHGAREAIEVFEVDPRGRGAPAVTWIGCIPAPAGAAMNSVTALADGRVIATDFYHAPRTMADALAGRNSGAVYQWRPGGAFEKLPGTDLPGPNGIEVTPDGRYLFVAVTGTSSVLRYELAATQKPPAVLKTDFRTDNLRWAPDGRLLLAGPGQDPNCRPPQRCSTVVVGALNPRTMALTELLRTPAEPDFQGLSAAMIVGRTLWLGSYLADRVAFARLRP